MSQISPPIRILLICAVAFLAAWMLFLRPSTDTGTPAADTSPATTTTPVEAGGADAGSASGELVEKANETAAAQDAKAEQLADGTGETVVPADPATATGAVVDPTATATATEPGKLTAKAAAAGGLPPRVVRALDDRKVVVLLFWSPKAAEDKAVRSALSGIDRHDGKVLAQATNVKRIAAYGQITRGADVQQSPSVVVVDRDRKVETLVGYVDRTSIDQAVTDALRNS
jgi:hypothetical protein